jgi:hypothetical protein
LYFNNNSINNNKKKENVEETNNSICLPTISHKNTYEKNNQEEKMKECKELNNNNNFKKTWKYFGIQWLTSYIFMILIERFLRFMMKSFFIVIHFQYLVVSLIVLNVFNVFAYEVGGIVRFMTDSLFSKDIIVVNGSTTNLKIHNESEYLGVKKLIKRIKIKVRDDKYLILLNLMLIHPIILILPFLIFLWYWLGNGYLYNLVKKIENI